MNIFRDNFSWYPEKEEGDMVSVRSTLAELDPSEYRQVVYEWSIRDFIIWSEEVWLANVWDDMQNSVE